jgi:hypothetical protein
VRKIRKWEGMVGPPDGRGTGHRDPVPRRGQGTNEQYRAMQTEPSDQK